MVHSCAMFWRLVANSSWCVSPRRASVSFAGSRIPSLLLCHQHLLQMALLHRLQWWLWSLALCKMRFLLLRSLQ